MLNQIKLGMVGGGQGAFIGSVHRIAARLDDHYKLVAGVLTSNPETSRASALELGIEKERSYSSFKEMADQESLRDDGIEAVSIVTPNYLHFPIAECFLSKGIHVICDKPLTHNLEDGEKFLTAVENSSALFALTHNYTGYPMVRQAREICRTKQIGDIRVVQVEYPQDWLTTPLENSPDSPGNKQASWRTDPNKAGAGGCVGDIGSHAFNLADFITGAELDELCADLSSFVPGRKNDDNAHVLLRFKNNIKGMLWSSQVAPGNENALKIRVYGDKGGLAWEQENPNYLNLDIYGSPKQTIKRSGFGTLDVANRVSRIPPGHPEGYLEGFANLYSDFAEQINAKKENRKPDSGSLLVPNINDGIKGIKFISKVVESSSKGGQWLKF